jgi:DNA-binding response OmpR family regulator
MTSLRVLCLTNNCKEQDVLRRSLRMNHALDFIAHLSEIEEILCLKYYDVLLITQSDGLFERFSSLRSQYRNLIVLFIAEKDLCKWRLQTKNTNTLLLIKPVRVELLRQHLEQHLVSVSLINEKHSHQSKLDSLLPDQQDFILTSLERRCLQFLLNRQSGKAHKLSLQTHLFGESGYLLNNRLDVCWHRLRKKLSVCAPEIILERERNGFLKITACAP